MNDFGFDYCEICGGQGVVWSGLKLEACLHTKSEPKKYERQETILLPDEKSIDDAWELNRRDKY